MRWKISPLAPPTVRKKKEKKKAIAIQTKPNPSGTPKSSDPHRRSQREGISLVRNLKSEAIAPNLRYIVCHTYKFFLSFFGVYVAIPMYFDWGDVDHDSDKKLLVRGKGKKGWCPS
jgi:hypothetical protein